jgi:hypothetical protein
MLAHIITLDTNGQATHQETGGLEPCHVRLHSIACHRLTNHCPERVATKPEQDDATSRPNARARWRRRGTRWARWNP